MNVDNKMNPQNASMTFIWNSSAGIPRDEITLICEVYNLNLLTCRAINESDIDTFEVTVYGLNADIDRLADDLDEDSIDVLDSIQASCPEDDDKYRTLVRSEWKKRAERCQRQFEEFEAI